MKSNRPATGSTYGLLLLAICMLAVAVVLPLVAFSYVSKRDEGMQQSPAHARPPLPEGSRAEVAAPVPAWVVSETPRHGAGRDVTSEADLLPHLSPTPEPNKPNEVLGPGVPLENPSGGDSGRLGTSDPGWNRPFLKPALDSIHSETKAIDALIKRLDSRDAPAYPEAVKRAVQGAVNLALLHNKHKAEHAKQDAETRQQERGRHFIPVGENPNLYPELVEAYRAYLQKLQTFYEKVGWGRKDRNAPDVNADAKKAAVEIEKAADDAQKKVTQDAVRTFEFTMLPEKVKSFIARCDRELRGSEPPSGLKRP